MWNCISILFVSALFLSCISNQTKMDNGTSDQPLQNCCLEINTEKCKFDIKIKNLASINRYELGNPKYYRYDIKYLTNSDTQIVRVYPEVLPKDWNNLFLSKDSTMHYDDMIRHHWGIYYDENISNEHEIDTIFNSDNGSKGILVRSSGKGLFIVKSAWAISFIVFPKFQGTEDQFEIIRSYYQWR
jgi:hypothetical protein